MYKRVIIFFSIFILCFGVALVNIFKISQGDVLCTAAVQQNLYKLKVGSMRGNIYDCKKRPLVGTEKETVISVVPDVKTPIVLKEILSETEYTQAIEQVKSRKPFLLKLKENRQIVADGINMFEIPKRYSENQLAQHILGYLNSDGQGVCGIEKTFNDYLNTAKGSIFLKYKIDALNRKLPGENITIDNTMYKSNKGVVLTIDKKIQKIAQIAANKYIKKGAIIITEVPNCEIRACLSMPSYSINNINLALSNSDSPLLNRALLPYNIGSVFKLITAAAILNENIDPDLSYSCVGKYNVEGHDFHCFDNKSHGEVNLERAIALSCNTYFIDKALKIGGEKILNLAEKLGLSKKIELIPEIISKPGLLPKKESLLDNKILANFSFGQGSLLVTPMQVAALLNTIASKGMYCKPQLLAGLVNENLDYTQRLNNFEKNRVLSEECSNKLINYMKASVEYGTSNKGKPEPECGIAVAKTGTAQTGIKVENRSVIQAWYAGIYPADNPKYSIVIFAEDAKGGGESCGPAFKKITQDIYFNILKNKNY